MRLEINWRPAGILLAAAMLLLTLPVSAQTVQTALVYNDNTPELQAAAAAYIDEMTLEGVSVQTTSDAVGFGNQLTAASYDAYAAFGTNTALLDSWLAQTPNNTQFLKVALVANGEIETEYTSFIAPASSRGVVLGRSVSGISGTADLEVQRQSEFSTATADGGLTPISTTPTQPVAQKDSSRFAMPFGWPWDGLVEAAMELFNSWLDDLLEWLQCIANCAQGCIDAFLDAIPEGVEVTISIEVQTTPPGVKTSISVTATGQAAVQVMKAYAKMVKCLGDCVANCSGGNRVVAY